MTIEQEITTSVEEVIEVTPNEEQNEELRTPVLAVEDDGDDDYVDEDEELVEELVEEVEAALEQEELEEEIQEVVTELAAQVEAEEELLSEEFEDADDDDEDDEDDDLDDGFDASTETLTQRLTALVDVIPPTLRAKIYIRAKKTYNTARVATGVVGTVSWILATAAFLTVLPIGLEYEREQFMLQQEAQARAAEKAQNAGAA